MASTAGLKGYGYVAPYAAAKHGVVGMVKSLALEVAKKPVTVNALCPGFLDTEMTDRSVSNIVAKTGMSPDAAREVLAASNPQKRLIRPDEVTSAALWLALALYSMDAWSTYQHRADGAAAPDRGAAS